MLKRLLAAILALAWILTVPVETRAADAGARVTLSVEPSFIVPIGSTVTVQVRIANAYHLAGFSFALSYDPAKLQLAKHTDGTPDIRVHTENDFEYLEGGSVNETEGRIVYPVLYFKPFSEVPVDAAAFTVRFVVLEEGTHLVQLSNVKVVDYTSRSVKLDPSAPNSAAVAAAAPIAPVGEEKFSMNSVIALLRPEAGAPLPDVNGDGVTDAEDVRFVLYQIEPVSFSSAAAD